MTGDSPSRSDGVIVKPAPTGKTFKKTVVKGPVLLA